MFAQEVLCLGPAAVKSHSVSAASTLEGTASGRARRWRSERGLQEGLVGRGSALTPVVARAGQEQDWAARRGLARRRDGGSVP